jgi:hypothetical protein
MLSKFSASTEKTLEDAHGGYAPQGFPHHVLHEAGIVEGSFCHVLLVLPSLRRV